MHTCWENPVDIDNVDDYDENHVDDEYVVPNLSKFQVALKKIPKEKDKTKL